MKKIIMSFLILTTSVVYPLSIDLEDVIKGVKLAHIFKGLKYDFKDKKVKPKYKGHTYRRGETDCKRLKSICEEYRGLGQSCYYQEWQHQKNIFNKELKEKECLCRNLQIIY